MVDHCLFIHVNLLAPVASPDTIPISEATILGYIKNRGFSGRILGDFADRPLKPQVLARAIQTDQPLVMGFTAYQENIEQIRLWARFSKKLSPGVKIILGGPQVTFMPGDALRHMPEIDFLCRGEGEEVMLGLAQALKDGRSPAHVPGLCILQNGQIVETGPAYGAKDLDLYPSPYLMDLIDLTHKERMIMLTSRGCSYQCAFCYTPRASHRKVRFYSTERIIEEMKYLKSKGIAAFWFADPNFSFSRKRLETLLEAIIREVPGITFWCQTRYDLVDRDMVSLLKRAGADNVAFGLESANPDVLRKIDKPIDLDRLSQVIRLTQDAGIQVELFSMFGLPGETFDQTLNTLKFVKDHQVAVDGNSISQQVHLFFGTPLNDKPEKYGIRPFRRTRPAYLSVCRDYETDQLSEDAIRRTSLIWRLNREDFADDVQSERNLFHRAAFITQNRRALADRPGASLFLTRIYLALEEYGAAVDTMHASIKAFPRDPDVRGLVEGAFTCFKLTSETAQPGFKVVFDCRGSVDGKPVPATYGRFQEGIVGNGSLLPKFEKHLCQMARGGSGRFEMQFPEAYGQQDLAGKIATFRVHVHCVLAPLTIERCEDLDEQGLRNEYPLKDREALRQYNINLYYKVMGGRMMRGQPTDPADGLMLTNLYLKLGFVDRAAEIAERLVESPVIFTHAAHIFRMNEQPQKALDLLQSAPQDGPKERLIRAQALFDLNRLEESEAAAKNISLPNNVQLADLRVQLAAKLALPVETYLEREEVLLDAKTHALM
ncbi:MAG: radical SAM protein [Deltaproteobacteria bacterium]|nr:radical SAM protein [Deltaproteobacteria bacterium]